MYMHRSLALMIGLCLSLLTASAQRFYTGSGSLKGRVDGERIYDQIGSFQGRIDEVRLYIGMSILNF